MASVTDAENRDITFEYDPLGRVKNMTSPDGVADQHLGYRRPRHRQSSPRPAAAMTSRSATRTTSRAGMPQRPGRLKEPATSLSYGYDDIGRLDCVTYPMIPGASGPGATDRLTVGHVYNAHGYLAQVKDGCEVGGALYWAAEARNGAGQLERERLGNDVVATRAYRAATGLLDRILTVGPGTVGRLGEIGYDYDDNRNVTQRSDLAHERVETYHYDVLDRLDGWSIPKHRSRTTRDEHHLHIQTDRRP